MPQFYPDGPAAVSLNAMQESGSINTPPQENFNTPGLQGSMQQILSENLGKFVIADFLIGISTIVRRVGVIYSVGTGFVVLYLESQKAFQVCDIFSLKFVTFFPPGSEPTEEEIITNPGGTGVLGTGIFMNPTTNSMPWSQSPNSTMGSGMGNNMPNRGNVNSSSCRTLGQR